MASRDLTVELSQGHGVRRVALDFMEGDEAAGFELLRQVIPALHELDRLMRRADPPGVERNGD